jgi:hypothetical protein
VEGNEETLFPVGPAVTSFPSKLVRLLGQLVPLPDTKSNLISLQIKSEQHSTRYKIVPKEMVRSPGTNG